MSAYAINVAVLADVSNFRAGMKTAEQTMAEFTEKSQSLGSGLGVSARGARIAAAQMGEAFAGLGSVIGGVAQSFILLGPEIGAIVAGFEIFNHLVKENEEALKQAAETARIYRDALSTANAAFTDASVGKYAEGTVAKADKIHADIMEIFNKDKNDSRLNSMTDQLVEVQNLGASLEGLSEKMSSLKDAEFELKLHGGSTAEEMANLKDQAFALSNELADLEDRGAQNSRAYQEVKNDLHAVWMEMKHLNDEDAKALAMSREADAKAMATQQEAIGKQFEESIQAAHRAGEAMTEAMLTPAEKYAEELENINDLLGQGVISQETASRAAKKAHDSALSAMDAGNKDVIDAGTFKQLDVSRISVAGLAMQRQKDPEAQKRHEENLAVLKNIEKNTESADVATVAKG